MNDLKPPRVIQFRLRIGNEIVGYEKWNRSNTKWWYCVKPGAKFPQGFWKPEPIYHVDKDQFTGLQDKNGTEIYEGDICKNGDWNEDAHAYNYRIEEVRWDKDSACWQGWNFNQDGMTCEIIGNALENPDLLKDKTQ